MSTVYANHAAQWAPATQQNPVPNGALPTNFLQRMGINAQFALQGAAQAAINGMLFIGGRAQQTGSSEDALRNAATARDIATGSNGGGTGNNTATTLTTGAGVPISVDPIDPIGAGVPISVDPIDPIGTGVPISVDPIDPIGTGIPISVDPLDPNCPPGHTPGGRMATPAQPTPAQPTPAQTLNTTSNISTPARGVIEGDPHFVGADGGKYDVQGRPGAHYNLLSDSGFQVNAKYDGKPDATVMTEAGLVVGSDQIKVDGKGAMSINGNAIDGNSAEGEGYSVKKDGDKVTVSTAEYEITLDTGKKWEGQDYMDISFSSDNVNQDGVMPHGLWGQTADGDGEAREGDKGKGAQGGGAIEDANGNRTAKGDKDAIKSYEVGALFDTGFDTHNRFFDNPQGAAAPVAAAGNTTS